eukprot:9481224-Pyramimonas_sp.AAC.1
MSGYAMANVRHKTSGEHAATVQGPISATILSLLRLEWDPVDTSTWTYTSQYNATEEWQSPGMLHTGNKDLDTHLALLEDVKRSTLGAGSMETGS